MDEYEEIFVEEVEEPQQPIGVYIRLNDKNEVVEVNSEIFISDLTGWIKIDEGYGDKYSHAQSNFFQKHIFTDLGDYTYEYVDDQVREIDHADSEARNEKARRINELKRLLAETDYKAIKYAEGVITAEEYAETKAQRQAWRDEINEIEGSL